jgi:lincosamide nucleotidyltransferase A/C/D/E
MAGRLVVPRSSPSARSLRWGMIAPVADHPHDAPYMSARDALALYSTFSERGVRCWVMGGWGVDALLGTQMRAHHDLDLLVARTDLGQLLTVLTELGFAQKLLWGESLLVDVDGVAQPTAFVQVDSEGRELDVHVLDVVDGAVPVAVCDVPWEFDETSLAAVGIIGGGQVRCVSAKTQLQMHTGYDLPPEHREDAERLARIVAGFSDDTTAVADSRMDEGGRS